MRWMFITTALLLSACGAPFEISTPSGMIELEEASWSDYDWRATTPDGIVLAVRSIPQGDGREVPQGSLEFWVEALTLRMRAGGGYALLSTEDAQSADGTPGTTLHFGRDQGGDTFAYDVTVFVTERWIHVVEAGGRSDRMDAYATALEQAVAGYRVRR